jgi:hypothetical protein
VSRLGRSQPGVLRGAAAWLGGAVVLAVAAIVLRSTGSPSRDLVAWVLAVTLAVVLPGAAVVRATRRTPVALADDLTWGLPVGVGVALAGWVVSRAVPVPGWLWGLLVTAALVVPARSRARVMARPRGRWGPATSLSVAAVLVVSLAWMWQEYLRWTPADPGPHGHVYYVDSIFHAAMFSELGRPGLPQYPMVAGQSLSYHWFLYAVLSRVSAGTGLDRLDLTLRLAPPTLVLAVLLLTAAVARQLSGRRVAAPLAAGLIGLTLATNPTRWSATGVGTALVNTVWWVGPPQTLGWLTGIAVVGAGIAVVRRSPADRSAAPALLLPCLVVLTSGAKSSQLPVVACGFALAAAVALVRRDRAQAARAAAVTLLIVAVFGLAAVTVYGGQSYGLRIAPGRSMVNVASAVFPGLVSTDPSQSLLLRTHLPAAAVVAAMALWLVPQLLRCAAVGWLVRRRPGDPTTWVTLGSALGGLAAFALLRHPGSSELFFPISAFPILAIGAACGLACVLPRGRRLRRWATLGSGVALAGFVVAGAIALGAGRLSPLDRWTARFRHPPTAADVPMGRQIWAWAWPLVAVLVAALVAAAVAALLTRRVRGACLAGVAVVLGVSCFATAALVTGADQPSYAQALAARTGTRPPALTRDLVSAGSWLSHHDRSTDVVAVNRACLPIPREKDPRICNSQDFTVTLATGLRSYVEGWAYAGRNVEAAWGSALRYNHQPFWDQPRLGRELDAFTAPSQAGYDALYASGVRWLLADRPSTPLPLARIDALADRELTLPTVTVWRLRPPRTGS